MGKFITKREIPREGRVVAKKISPMTENIIVETGKARIHEQNIKEE